MDTSGSFSLSPALKDFISGAVAGAFAITVSQPLDTVRVRIQQSALSGGQLDTLGVLVALIRKEGVLAPFKGLTYPLLFASVQSAILFQAYGWTLRQLSDQQPAPQHSLIQPGGPPHLRPAPLASQDRQPHGLQAQPDPFSRFKHHHQHPAAFRFPLLASLSTSAGSAPERTPASAGGAVVPGSLPQVPAIHQLHLHHHHHHCLVEQQASTVHGAHSVTGQALAWASSQLSGVWATAPAGQLLWGGRDGRGPRRELGAGDGLESETGGPGRQGSGRWTRTDGAVAGDLEASAVVHRVTIAEQEPGAGSGSDSGARSGGEASSGAGAGAVVGAGDQEVGEPDGGADGHLSGRDGPTAYAARAAVPSHRERQREQHCQQPQEAGQAPLPTPWHGFLAGGVAGMAQVFLWSPVELLKLRAQLQTATPGAAGYRNPAALAAQVLRNDGVAGLYRGFGLTVVRDVPSYAMYFWLYHDIAGALSPGMHPEQAPPSTQVLAGGLAGVIAWLPIYPLDVLKTRVQAVTACAGGGKGWSQYAREMYLEGGSRAFFRGIAPTLMRAFVMDGASFLGYTTTLKMLGGAPETEEGRGAAGARVAVAPVAAAGST